MVAYNACDARRIHHFIKVYGFAKMIGETEGLDADTQEILEIAALTHDIGIRNSERKYGNCSGAHQQEEGPPEARALLRRSKREVSLMPFDVLLDQREVYQRCHGLAKAKLEYSIDGIIPSGI